jgi:hypothetical protein
MSIFGSDLTLGIGSPASELGRIDVWLSFLDWKFFSL